MPWASPPPAQIIAGMRSARTPSSSSPSPPPTPIPATAALVAAAAAKLAYGQGARTCIRHRSDTEHSARAQTEYRAQTRRADVHDTTVSQMDVQAEQ